MNENIVLKVSNLKKRFKIYPGSWSLLKEWISLGRHAYHREFWALNGVSFEISRGEFVGIIGPNGAGKSTLLKLITNVLRPTDGSYQLNGRVLSILELSGGTDDNLTGRENVLRSGQLMGFPEGYVQERMERIREFSELGDFFEQPLRMYSTGMRTRLSFSMFAFMDTDILILDEVLAVGDIFFKQKCFSRLAELIEQKTAILLVTHSMGIIEHYCNRVILLNNGEKVFDGETTEAIRQFLEIHGESRAKTISKLVLDEEGSSLDMPPSLKNRLSVRPDNWPSNDVFRFSSFPKIRGNDVKSLTHLAVLNEKGEPALTFMQGDRLHIYIVFVLKEGVGPFDINIEIRDKLNLLVHSKSSSQNNAEFPALTSSGGIVHYYQNITLNLAPDNYIVNIDCFYKSQEISEKEKNLNQVKRSTTQKARLWRLDQAFAIAVMPRYLSHTELSHGGLCDLPGESLVQIISESP